MQNSNAINVIPFSKQYDKLHKFELVEMQGQLQMKPDLSASLAGQDLGSFTVYPAANKNQEQKCELIIGKQLLDGKKTALKKPLIVAQKVIGPNNTVQYKIVGQVTDRTMFRNRPTPLSPRK